MLLLSVGTAHVMCCCGRISVKVCTKSYDVDSKQPEHFSFEIIHLELRVSIYWYLAMCTHVAEKHKDYRVICTMSGML